MGQYVRCRLSLHRLSLPPRSPTRWTVESASPRIQPASEPDPRSFSPRTHPGRPPEQGQRDSRGARAGDGRYPPRCNPRRARPPLDEGQRELATRYLPLARVDGPTDGNERCPRRATSSSRLPIWPWWRLPESFDPGRNVNFATYARHRIQGALLDLRREIRERESRDRRTATGLKKRKGEFAGPSGRAVDLALRGSGWHRAGDSRHRRELDPAASPSPRPGVPAHLPRRQVPGRGRGPGGLLEIHHVPPAQPGPLLAPAGSGSRCSTTEACSRGKPGARSGSSRGVRRASFSSPRTRA